MHNRPTNNMLKLAIISTILAPITWFLWVLCEEVYYKFLPDWVNIVLVIAFIMALTAAICAWITLLFYRIRKKQNNTRPSIFLCFAVIDIILMLVTAAYAVFDLLTSKGAFAGLVGFILLIFIIPIMLLVLIIDCVVAYIYRRKGSNQNN